MSKSLFLRAAILAIPAAVLAEVPPPAPSPFSGTVISHNDSSVTLKNRQGETVVVRMTPGWTVSINREGIADEIRPGSFVATNNAPVDANTGESTELRILEPGYRPEEGTHGLSSSSTSEMTHGIVKTAGKTAAGMELEVTWPGGSRHIVVPPNAPITVSEPRSRNALQPGTAVEGMMRTGGDGVPRAGRVTISDGNPLQLSPHHATASVADIEKEAGWYEQVLGFHEVTRVRNGDAFELRQMGIPGYRIDLLWQRGSSRPTEPSDSSRQGWFHVVFRTPVVDAIYKRLVDLGTDVKADRNDKSAINRLVFHDPEGNEVEILPQ